MNNHPLMYFGFVQVNQRRSVEPRLNKNNFVIHANNYIIHEYIKKPKENNSKKM